MAGMDDKIYLNGSNTHVGAKANLHDMAKDEKSFTFEVTFLSTPVLPHRTGLREHIH